MKKKLSNVELKERAFFYLGLIFGLGGGVIGNVLVTSSFNLINDSCKTGLCFYGTIILETLSLIIFVIVIFSLFNQFNKIMKGLKK